MSRASSLGRVAEEAAADFLFASGFNILRRNVRLGALELDIVARKGDLVVVAEVRTRGPGSLETSFASITARKRHRLRQAVERLWVAELARMVDVERLRIDAVAVDFHHGETRIECAEGIQC